jgi:hypothetical protein
MLDGAHKGEQLEECGVSFSTRTRPVCFLLAGIEYINVGILLSAQLK